MPERVACGSARSVPSMRWPGAPRPRDVTVPRQVSWLAGRRAGQAFPVRRTSGRWRQALAAHSCGGSFGSARGSPPNSLFARGWEPTRTLTVGPSLRRDHRSTDPMRFVTMLHSLCLRGHSGRGGDRGGGRRAGRGRGGCHNITINDGHPGGARLPRVSGVFPWRRSSSSTSPRRLGPACATPPMKSSQRRRYSCYMGRIVRRRIPSPTN